MQLDSLKKKIAAIEKIIDQISAREITPIDKDLLLQRLREVYQQVLDWEALLPDVEPVSEEVNDTSGDDIIEEKNDADNDKEIIPPAENVVPEPQNEIPPVNEVDKNEVVNDNASPDLFSSEKDVSEGSTSVEDKIRQHKIEDLKKAIGINEKFQMINQLFEGDIKEYTLAIGAINEAVDKDEAIAKLDELQEKYHWNIESEAFEMIKSLTERRHM